MEIIKVKNNKLKPSDLKEVILVLKKGGVIIYPTETAYGLGGDALNKKVIKKIFSLKSRSQKKPLPVIVGAMKPAEKIAVFNPLAKKLAKKYWPGPLTLVLKKKKSIPSLLTAGRNKIAVRVSSSLIARTIAAKLAGPLISTSANFSGKKECYTVKAVLKQLAGIRKNIDFILEAGRLPMVKPSTIVEVSDHRLKVIRKGPIKLMYNE